MIEEVKGTFDYHSEIGDPGWRWCYKEREMKGSQENEHWTPRI